MAYNTRELDKLTYQQLKDRKEQLRTLIQNYDLANLHRTEPDPEGSRQRQEWADEHLDLFFRIN